MQAEQVDFGIHFARAAQALCWAEEFAQRPNYPNYFRLIGMPRGSVSAGGPNYNDLLDLANTITLAARTLARPEATNTFLLAHLSGVSVRELLKSVALALWEHIAVHPRAKRLSRRQRLALAIVSARNFRVLHKAGKPLPKAEYARKLHVDPSALRAGSPWPDLFAHADLVLAQWYEEAHWEFVGKLEALGVL